MEKEYFKGNWNQIKGSLKRTWGDLTDDDLKKMEGSYDESLGVLQEKYGLAKDDAKKKLDDIVKDFKN